MAVFLDAEELFENEVRVEINGVNRQAELETPTKRVRIEPQQASPASTSSSPKKSDEDKEVHAGVVCDCCDEAIVGFRYKCTQCFNFDLCMACEGKMRHREHIMMRIPSPTLSLYPPAMESRRHWKKHLETVQPEEQEKAHRHHGKKRHDRRRCNRSANLFDGFFRALAEESPLSDVEPAQAEASPTINTNNAQQQQPSAPTTNQQVPPPPMYDFHKLVKVVEAVAGNVSKLFDPMGMSLETYADYGINVPPTSTTPAAGPTASAETATAPEQPNANKASVVADPKPTEVRAAQIVDQMVLETDAVASTESTPLIPAPSIIDIIDDTSNQSAIIQPTTEDMPMSPSNTSDGKKTKALLDGIINEYPYYSTDAEWLVISNEGMPDESLEQDKATQVSPRKELPQSVASTSVQTGAASAENSAQTQGYEELARKLQKDIEEQLRLNSSTSGTQTSASEKSPVPMVYHPVPHINMSIQRMLDMGFSNDGGCLTELMACCNGDIRRALDSLLYKK